MSTAGKNGFMKPSSLTGHSLQAILIRVNSITNLYFPLFFSTGILSIENIPTQQKIITVTPLMINIGYYIKAMELLAFRIIIEKYISTNALIL